MHRVIRTLVVALAVSFGSSAGATCFYNGGEYATGTRVGPFQCMPDGRWARPTSGASGAAGVQRLD